MMNKMTKEELLEHYSKKQPQDFIQYISLIVQFGLPVFRIVQVSAIAIPQHVDPFPTENAQIATGKHRCEGGLDHGLAGLAVVAVVGKPLLLGKLLQRRLPGTVLR